MEAKFKTRTHVQMINEAGAIQKCGYEGCVGQVNVVQGTAENGVDVVIQCLTCGAMIQEAPEFLESSEEYEWNHHRIKCPICRRHVSIEGLILREEQLCKKGRGMARAYWAVAEADANMGAE